MVAAIVFIVAAAFTDPPPGSSADSPTRVSGIASHRTDAGRCPDQAPACTAAPGCPEQWFLAEGARYCVRQVGRKNRVTGEELAHGPQNRTGRMAWRPALPKWMLPLLMSLFMFVLPGRQLAAADPPVAADQIGAADGETAAPAVEQLPATARSASYERRRQRQQPSEDGAFPRRPFYGMPNVVVNDPATYPRPDCLENNNPRSFWYSMRPNIFNVPVEAEWDFYNIINTDRPDFTDAVYSVGKGVTYLETGFTYSKINTASQYINTRQLPESLLRHGLTDEFEIRLKWPGYLMSNIRDPHSGAQVNSWGSEDIDAGFKWELLQQRGWRPMTTLVAGMTLPTGAQGTSANYVQPHFNFLFGWGIRRWLYVKQQVGCDFVHSSSTQIVTPLVGSSNPTFVAVRSPPNSWHESISILTQWTKRVGAFHEWFMISPTGGGHSPAQHFLDMGLYLYATPNVQFDFRVGRQLSNRVDDFFTGAGFSGRW